VSELRRIPSTHVAAALGFSDWSSPLSVWASCRSGRPWDQNPDAPHTGVRLMPALRNWAAETLKGRVWAASVVERERLLMKPDGQTDDGRLVLFRIPKDPTKWEEQLEDGEEREPELILPRDVLLEAQVLHAHLRPKEVWVGALLAGNLRMLRIERDEKTASTMASALHIFWERNVVTGREPKATKVDEKLLRALHPKPTLKEKKFSDLSDEQQQAVLNWAAEQRIRAAAEREEKKFRPEVLQCIGDHSGIIDFPLDCTVSSVSCDVRDPYPNNGTWKAIANEYLAKLKPAAAERLVKKHTPEEGTKVLRPFFTSKSRPLDLPEPPGEAKGAA
jgi:hypothetical protein